MEGKKEDKRKEGKGALNTPLISSTHELISVTRWSLRLRGTVW
jgi:hypothetical protein